MREDMVAAVGARQSGARFAAEFNVEVMEKLLIRTASGWLERLDGM